jgi:hypothetical protein
MLTAMARELVTANGVGESAAAVWRQIQSENNCILNCADRRREPVAVEEESVTTSLLRAALSVDAVVEALKFGARPPLMRPLPRRRAAPPTDAQFPLLSKSSWKTEVAKVGYLQRPVISLDFRSSNAAIFPFEPRQFPVDAGELRHRLTVLEIGGAVPFPNRRFVSSQ